MRKSRLVLGICLVVVFLIGCKTTEINVVKESTVEGMTYAYVDIDPVVVGQTWEEVAREPLNQFTIEIYFRNPDKNHAIQFASLVVTPAGVGAYSYMVDGRIDVFGFNTEVNAYESVWDTLDEKSKQIWYDDYKSHFGLSDS